MDNFEAQVTTEKKLPVIVQLLIGILGGACISGLLLYLGSAGIIFTFLMFQAIILGGIVYGFGGLYAAIAMIATAEIGIYITGGILGCVLMLAAFVIPFGVYVYSCEKKCPFFKTLEALLLSAGLGVVISLVIVVRVSGNDIGKMFSDMMLSSIETLSEEGKKSLAEIYASVFAYSGYTLDTSDPTALLNSIAVYMQDSVRVTMPFLLICLVTENALLCALTGGFIRVKRRVPDAVYEPVSKWRLPFQVTLGIIGFILIGFILSKTSGTSGEVVLVTALGAGFIGCEVQTIASIYDKLSQLGIRFIFRILWILFLIIGFGFFPLFYGSLSALFGRKGLIKQLRAYFSAGSGSNNNDSNDNGGN